QSVINQKEEPAKFMPKSRPPIERPVSPPKTSLSKAKFNCTYTYEVQSSEMSRYWEKSTDLERIADRLITIKLAAKSESNLSRAIELIKETEEKNNRTKKIDYTSATNTTSQPNQLSESSQKYLTGQTVISSGKATKSSSELPSSILTNNQPQSSSPVTLPSHWTPMSKNQYEKVLVARRDNSNWKQNLEIQNLFKLPNMIPETTQRSDLRTTKAFLGYPKPPDNRNPTEEFRKECPLECRPAEHQDWLLC
ncbi:unnamed protein product, partial [Didymodactylos carnosus]